MGAKKPLLSGAGIRWNQVLLSHHLFRGTASIALSRKMQKALLPSYGRQGLA